MRRPAAYLIASSAALALIAAPADAKEVASAKACDDDGCRTITARSQLRGMEEGAPATAPAKGARFYRVRMTVKVPGEKDFRYSLVYVPSEGLLRVRGEFDRYDWLAATPAGVRGFERLTRGLTPEPASELRGVGLVDQLPQARVDEVVAPPPSGDEDGGFPWAILLVPAGLALAATTLRVTRPHLRGARVSPSR